MTSDMDPHTVTSLTADEITACDRLFDLLVAERDDDRAGPSGSLVIAADATDRDARVAAFA